MSALIDGWKDMDGWMDGLLSPRDVTVLNIAPIPLSLPPSFLSASQAQFTSSEMLLLHPYRRYLHIFVISTSSLSPHLHYLRIFVIYHNTNRTQI